MNLSGADKIIAEFLAANWTTTPIAWPNVEPRSFSMPGQPLLPMGDDDYVAVRTSGAGSRTITVPGHCIRYAGQLFASACVREGTGVRGALAYVDTLLELLENATLVDGTGSVRFNNATGPVGYPAPNGWHVEEVALMFYFERFVANP